jgi:hypothetical protein
LKLKHYEALSNFAFNFNLHNYIVSSLSGVARSKASGLNLSGAIAKLSKEPGTEILSTVEAGEDGVYDFGRRRPGRGLHSSTSQLNLSRLCH